MTKGKESRSGGSRGGCDRIGGSGRNSGRGSGSGAKTFFLR